MSAPPPADPPPPGQPRPSPRDAAPGGLRFAIRRLIRGANRATLATRLPEDGQPYASLVTVATDTAGRPLLLLSRLAEHTRALAADGRLALLFDGTAGYANPQQGPRVTLLGRLSPPLDGAALADAAARRRFLARHPAAQLYAGFADFAFHAVEPERAHWVGGFARAVWLDQGLTCEAPLAAEFAAAEAAVLAHMNEQHGEALTLMAQRLLGQNGGGWQMTAVDPDGCDLARDLDTDNPMVVRLAFETPLTAVAELRFRLQELANRARYNS